MTRTQRLKKAIKDSGLTTAQTMELLLAFNSYQRSGSWIWAQVEELIEEAHKPIETQLELF